MKEKCAPAGITRTERYLGQLANKSFLSLWSHQNLFRAPGKELCDLLVACHNIVIIFSDKEVIFDLSKPIEDAWARWYNRTVLKSVPQLKRARNWILNHADRVFLDARCNHTAPLFDLINEKPEIHLVAIANGASNACLRHFEGGSGSLLVSSSADAKNPDIFMVGNPGDSDCFVHVFDEAHLNVILQELDTITDFRDYLTSRRRLISIDGLFAAAGEEDMLAVYLKKINQEGFHDFVWDSGKPIQLGQKILIEEGTYDHYRKAAPYRRKKLADRQSYLWDKLIEKFAGNYSAGTLAKVPEFLGKDGRDGGSELGLRYMALERRVQRRSHAKAILGAFVRLEESKGNRFFRAMMPENAAQGDTAFCILLLKPSMAPEGTSYDNYRQFRAANLAAYTENLLERNRHLKRVIGLATEGTRGGRSSEDLIYHEPPEWTDEAITSAQDTARHFEIFRSETGPILQSVSEYPESDQGLRGEFDAIPYVFARNVTAPISVSPGNRRARRAARARARK